MIAPDGDEQDRRAVASFCWSLTVIVQQHALLREAVQGRREWHPLVGRLAVPQRDVVEAKTGNWAGGRC